MRHRDRAKQPLEFDERAALEQMSPSERPRMLPLFPSGWAYFRRWHSARWFVVLTIPIGPSVFAAFWRHQLEAALLISLIGLAIAALLFVVLACGLVSSNWGTYFRRRESARYWLDVGILFAGYVGICAAGWFVK